MKQLLFAGIIAFATNAFAGGDDDVLNPKKAKNYFAKLPELSVYESTDGKQVEKISYYMYRYEVSNGLYRLFLRDLAASGNTQKLAAATIDSSGWQRKPLSYGSPYVQYYASHPAYQSYPVVNITHEGAMLFCAWLTEKYAAYKSTKDRKVTFRLPDTNEWTIAAKSGNPNAIYPWNGPYIRNHAGLYQCNFSIVGDENIIRNQEQQIEEVPVERRNTRMDGQDYADVTAPVKSYWPNNYGIYNMSGNVAEMLLDPGKTKGGSWRNTGFEVRIDAPDLYEGYTAGSPFIGFRMLMVMEHL